MAKIRTSNIPQQAADHLREGVVRGRWVGQLPGRNVLASELGVSPRSVQRAIELLAKEGLIKAQGQGKPHLILQSGVGVAAKPMRVALLLFKQADRHDPSVIEIRHQLDDAGHVVILPHEGVQDLGMDLNRVKRLVSKTNADAWVVPGASAPVLQ